VLNIRIDHNCPSTFHPVSSGVTLGCPNLLRQRLIGRFCLPAYTFYRLAKPPSARPQPESLFREPLRSCRTAAPTLDSVGWPAPALVVPVGRPHSRSHSRFAVDAGLSPAAGSTGTAPVECETQSARPGGRNLRLKRRNRLLLLQITSTSRTRGGQRYLYYFVDLLSGPGDDSFDNTSGRFSVPVSGVGLGAGVARGGRLSFTGAQSGECSKTMILICVDQSEVKTVGRTDIDLPELNPVTVWHHPKSNVLRNERHERPGRESLGGGA
jgi:hypothetical protein